jgi:hypothetical protein
MGLINAVEQLINGSEYGTNGTSTFSFQTHVFLSSGLFGSQTIADDSLTATIAWDSFQVFTSGDPVSFSGTGIVTASSGDDPFEADFPIGGTFDITYGWFPNLGGAAGGTVTPTTVAAVPAPSIGIGWIVALFTLAIMMRHKRKIAGNVVVFRPKKAA